MTYTRVDFKCGSVLVEAKALDALSSVHLSQAINYLKARWVSARAVDSTSEFGSLNTSE
jgi:hypothetical protein